MSALLKQLGKPPQLPGGQCAGCTINWASACN
jgi:hypothetical protein